METQVVRLPSAALGIVDVQDGEVVIHLDALEKAVRSLPLARLADFAAGPAAILEEITRGAKDAVLHAMDERGINSLPLADGRKIEAKRSVSYAPDQAEAEKLQAKLKAEGFGGDEAKLVWSEQIPARIETRMADIRVLRKALSLIGISDQAAQDEWLRRTEERPRLMVSGSPKSEKAKARIEAAKDEVAEKTPW